MTQTLTINEQEAVANYERDGVLKIERLFSKSGINDLKSALDDYATTVVPTLPAKDVTFEADGKSIRNLWRLEQHSPFFKALSQKPQILSLVRQLVHGDPVNMAVETFNKPARVGSGVPPHQDNAYFCLNPPDALTIWIAIDAVTSDNGPVFYAQGSHKLGLLEHRPSGVKGNSMGLAEKVDLKNPFVGYLEPGDALIHHCQTIHFSGPNRTDVPRCGFLMVYRGAHAQTDSALKKNYDNAQTIMMVVV